MINKSNDRNISESGGIYLRVELSGAIIYVGVYFLIISSGIVGNSLVLISFIRFKEVRKVNNYYIFGLAIADFFTCLISVPVAICNRLIISDLTCHAGTRPLFFLPAYTLSSVSIFLLFAITIDRYIAISRPLRYSHIMTRKKTKRIVLGVWLFGMSFGTLPGLNFGSDPYQWVCELDMYESGVITSYTIATAMAFSVGLAFIFSMYGRIVYIAYVQKTTVTNTRSSVSKRSRDQMRMRTTITCVLISAIFGICWLPQSFKNIFETYLARDIKSLLAIQTMCEMLAYSNSSINPILYGWRNIHFRRAYMKILRSWFGNDKKTTNMTSQETETKSIGLSAISLKVSSD
ncbi:Adenosine receptor A2a [Holothuria leucospilota]|uniref:Adenosine receptor A2a n=1 Tax=Holothuria leucospilota TaxID=206669 RepID=A0A9Q1BJC7_HOLLE|nr:Adenosine receptor A2a [Holothuria leucospilota]